MHTFQPIVVYVTFDSEEEARMIARTVVEEKLAACANVRTEGTSYYTWNAALEEAQEWIVLFKTQHARFAALQQRIVALRSYDTPCVIAWELRDGHPGYLAWIEEMTSGVSTDSNS